MRIVLLAHGLHAAGGRSVGLNVLHTLAQVGRAHEYLAIVPDDDEYVAAADTLPGETLAYRRTTALRRLWFDRVQLPQVAAHFRPDWIWGLGNLGFPRPPCRQAILLHKPQLVYPRRHRPGETWRGRLQNGYLRRALGRALRRTDILFCQTDTMRRRAAATFGFPGRLELMPNALSSAVRPDAKHARPAALGERDGVCTLFCLTRYYPHKNLELLVECFRMFGDALRDVRCVLTVSPENHPGARRLLGRIEACGLGRQIVNVGPIPQHEIAAYYQHCDALLLPTLLESQSGTYIEAMAFGKPVLTSELDFAREACGEAALYFDPWNAESLRDALLSFANSHSMRECLGRRSALRSGEVALTWESIVTNALGAMTAPGVDLT